MKNLPAGLTEADFVRTVQEVVKVLAHNFVFGYYDLEDIKQQAYLYAVEAMSRYDSKRPLANFLYVHVRNRLNNLRRNQLRRSDPPCMLCHLGRKSEHLDGEVCEKYRRWRHRNDAKSNLMRPLDIANVVDDNLRTESQVEARATESELKAKIDAGLPVELRSAYLKLLAKEPVTKASRLAVEREIRRILGCQ